MMPWSVVVGYETFRGPWCLHLPGEVTGDGKGSEVAFYQHCSKIQKRVDYVQYNERK